jgi:ferric-dicitrate binding protein FerR (iron transport regulator)
MAMNGKHLSEEEWGVLLAEEGEPSSHQHLASCAACQEKLRAWQGALGQLTRWQPDPRLQAQVRAKALQRAFRRPSWALWLPLAAAAAVGAVLLWVPSTPPPAGDVDAILQEVDATLARDPLTALAEAPVVGIVVPEESSGERSET